MERQDSTTPEYQAEFKGRHMLTNGRYGQGQRRWWCNCGWKLIRIPERAPQLIKASKLYQAHLDEVGVDHRGYGMGRAR